MSNTQRVKDFIAAWEARDLEQILARFAPDAAYHNIGMPVLKGREAIREALAPFLAGSTDVRWTIHHIAETADGVVLTERTDVFVMGPKTITIPVMGTFELRDGLVAAWRDYFDVADFQRQLT